MGRKRPSNIIFYTALGIVAMFGLYVIFNWAIALRRDRTPEPELVTAGERLYRLQREA